MKLIKSLLLGAATGLVGVAVAHAADLPRRTKGPAVEYVRICDTYGAGFFYVPGSTDTCIHVGGFLRADYDVLSTHDLLGMDGVTPVVGGSAGAQNASSFGGRFQVQLDVRTATEYGVLRAFGAGDFNYGPGFGTQGSPYGNGLANTGFAEKAFIQFGGLTAGLATSFYDFYIYGADDFLSTHSSYSPIGLLAYTATFGGGFSATLSLEDPRSRAMGYYDNPAGLPVGASAALGGQRFPDVVANLRVDQGWGSAQLSGAVHQGQILTVTGSDKTETGYAILGGLKINLPMLAAGDALYFEAAYADGATGYLGYDGFSMGAAQQQGATVEYPTVDGVVIGNNIFRTTGFEGLVALRHYWTPSFFTAGIVGYAQLDQSSAVKGTAFGAGGLGNWSEWRFGLTNEWIPAAGFKIGVEVEYARVHQTFAAGAPAPVNYGTWHGKLRLERDF